LTLIEPSAEEWPSSHSNETLNPLFYFTDVKDFTLVRIYNTVSSSNPAISYGPTQFRELKLTINDNRTDLHGRFDHQTLSNPINGRKIIYAATRFGSDISSLDSTIFCCLQEKFKARVDINDLSQINARKISFIHTKRNLKLLDFRNDGLSRVNAPKTIISSVHRPLTQAWACHFYKIFSDIDGIIYPSYRMSDLVSSAECSQYSVVALFERMENELICHKDLDLNKFRNVIEIFNRKFYPLL
jgi:hypothetical protein